MATSSREDLQKYLMPDYVDMSALQPPQVIEELDFEVILRKCWRISKQESRTIMRC